MKLIAGTLILLALLPCTAQSFDNQRDGFSLGLYPGIGRVTYSDYVAAGDKGEVAISPSLLLGIGLNELTAISLNLTASFYSTDRQDGLVILTSSVGARRYLHKDGNSFHVGGGVGVSVDNSHGYDGSPPVFAYLGELSVGYLLGHLDSQVRLQTGKRFVDSETLSLLSVSVGYLFF